MDEISKTKQSSETSIALLQRDVAYIRASQDKQSALIDGLSTKIDYKYAPREYVDLRLKEIQDRMGWYDKIIGFITLAIGSSILYALLNLVVKGGK